MTKKQHSPNFLFYTFLLILVWAPLPLGSNLPWAYMFLCMLIFALSALWCGFYLFNKTTVTVAFKKAITVIFLLYFAQGFVAWQLFYQQTIDLHASLIELLLGISYSLLFCLSLLLINSQQRIKITLYVLVASGLFQAMLGSLMVLTGVEYLLITAKEHYLGNATGTFVNRNHLAGYLVMCLSLGIGLMIAGLKPGTGNLKEITRRVFEALLSSKIILRLSLVIMVAGLVMTHSRMGNSAFFISMGVIGTLAVILKGKSIGSTVLLLTSLVLIDIAVVGTFFGIENVIDRLEKTSQKSETRDEVNLYSIKLVEDNVLTGTGTGTFYSAFPEVRKKDIGFMFYDHAHNDYVEFLTERGIIGIAPLLLAVIITFLVALKALYKRRNPLMRGCAFGCLMSMLAMAIHATVDFNLQIPANSATFMVVLAMGWIGGHHKGRRGKVRS